MRRDNTGKSARPSGRVATRIVVASIGVGAAMGGIVVAAVAATNAVPPRQHMTPAINASQTAAGLGANATSASTSVLAGLANAQAVQGISLVPSVVGNSSLPMVRVTLSKNVGAANAGGQARATWLGAIAEGAFSDREHTTQQSLLDVISGGQVVEPDSNGTGTVTYSLGGSNVAAGQVFTPPTDSALTARVSAVAAQYGLVPQNATVLHPMGSALDVTFVVPDGLNPTWSVDDLINSLAGTPVQLDGVLVTLVTPAGVPLLVEGSSNRAGFGSLWFANGQDVRFSAGHGSQYIPSALTTTTPTPTTGG